MLNVFILEDDPMQRKQVQIHLKRLANELKVTLNLHPFANPAALKKELPPASSQNLFLLDLEINGNKKAGLDLSQQIRQHDPDAAIIFMTTHEELLYRTYKYRVSALDFIAKDVDNIYQELKEDLQKIITKLNAQKSNSLAPFIYHDYSNTIKVDFMNINYFESNAGNSHSALLNTVNNQQRQLNYNLRDIEKSDQRFFRTHRSYLINPAQVSQVDAHHGIVHFKNGDTCPVSKLHIRELLKRITNNY